MKSVSQRLREARDAAQRRSRDFQVRAQGFLARVGRRIAHLSLTKDDTWRRRVAIRLMGFITSDPEDFMADPIVDADVSFHADELAAYERSGNAES